MLKTIKEKRKDFEEKIAEVGKFILKNKKNPLSEKIFKSKKLQKWPKQGQKWPFFGPGGPNFAKIKKRLGHSLTFTPERLYTKFQKIWLIRLGENVLQTDKRTDGTEIIGPSGKITRTNNRRTCQKVKNQQNMDDFP